MSHSFDSIMAQFGASNANEGRIYPPHFASGILAALSGKVERVVVPFPVEGWQDTGLLDALDALDTVATVRTVESNPRATYNGVKGHVDRVAGKVGRSVTVHPVKNADGRTIAASVTVKAS